MIKLDNWDKQILGILLENSREHVTKIGKKIKLRRENVNYRIGRLIKNGLIKEFNTVVSEKAIGLSHYVVFLELVNLYEGTEKEILNYLRKSDFMGWIGTSAGRWSLTFDIIFPKDKELNEIIKKFLLKFGKYIGDYVILNFYNGDYFPHKFLGFHKQQKYKEILVKKIKLDKKDMEILSMLNADARISFVDIAAKVGLTANAINIRVKNLEKFGFIDKYTISIDWKQLGYEWYGIQLKFIKFNESIEGKLVSYFEKHDRIIFYYKYLNGLWDYDIGVILINSEELREFINEFRREFSDYVKISDVFITLEETSGYKLPKGVFV